MVQGPSGAKIDATAKCRTDRAHDAREPDQRAVDFALMTKRSTPTSLAKGLTAGERMLLLCAASGMDWQQARIPAETLTAMVVKEMIERHAGGRLRLTGYGRVVLRAMLPDL